jgi:acyl-CoA synthetase (AMP-forming)/AMP-acid ligase II
MSGAALERIDALLRRHAKLNGDRIALIDAPDRANVTGGAPRTLTYAEVDRIVDVFAHRLHALGLHRGSVIAVQLPHTVESILTCLGILRAGMVAALLPQLWHRRDIVAALAPLGPKAIITATRIGDVAAAEIAMAAAVDLFTVRYVCAFGNDTPDGVVPCDDVFDVAHDGVEAAASPPDARPDGCAEPAVITFDQAWGDAVCGPVAVTRNQRQVLAGGQAICAVANLPAGASILSPLPLSSFAGFCLTLLSWLLSGGTLALHCPFDVDIFAGQMRDHAVDCAILPGPALTPLVDVLAGVPSATVLGLWRAPERHVVSAPWSGTLPALIDVLSFGETGFVPVPRQPSGQPGAIPVSLSSNAEESVRVILTEAGTIALSGAMVAGVTVPPGQWATEETSSVVDTGFGGHIDAQTDALIVTGGRPGMIAVGGYAFQSAELDSLAGETHLGARFTSTSDDLLGQRPAGQSLHPALVREMLAERGINPLLIEAFRDQPAVGPSVASATSLDADPKLSPTALTGR